MDMTGQHTIPASRQIVWEALNDPDVLKECIPGCEEIEKTGDTGFTAKVSVKVGPVGFEVQLQHQSRSFRAQKIVQSRPS